MPQWFDRVAATFAALVIIGLVAFLLIRNTPIAQPQLFFALRVVLSLSAAILGATIPGFLNVEWSAGGLVVRAGGALALFVLTYVYTPDIGSAPPPAAKVGITTDFFKDDYAAARCRDPSFHEQDAVCNEISQKTFTITFTNKGTAPDHNVLVRVVIWGTSAEGTIPGADIGLPRLGSAVSAREILQPVNIGDIVSRADRIKCSQNDELHRLITELPQYDIVGTTECEFLIPTLPAGVASAYTIRCGGFPHRGYISISSDIIGVGKSFECNENNKNCIIYAKDTVPDLMTGEKFTFVPLDKPFLLWESSAG